MYGEPDDLVVKRFETKWGGAAVCTHRGLVRTNNEDYYGASEDGRLFAIADGMGGHPKGEVASEVAVKAAVKVAGKTPYQTVANAIDAAQAAVWTIPSRDGELKPGCTLVVACVQDGRVQIGSVGDSRVYYFARPNTHRVDYPENSSMERVTRDHSIRGELTQSIGGGVETAVGSNIEIGVVSGDMLLLCTDGLHGFVPDIEIEAVMQMARASREAALRRLVGLAFERGAPDNITCMVIKIGNLQGTW